VARAQVQPVAAGPGRAPRQVLCRLVRHARPAEHSAGRAAREERAAHLRHARRLDVERLPVLPLRAQLRGRGEARVHRLRQQLAAQRRLHGLALLV